jgi:hypothetical protein
MNTGILIVTGGIVIFTALVVIYAALSRISKIVDISVYEMLFGWKK